VKLYTAKYTGAYIVQGDKSLRLNSPKGESN
jgi:hypothetical protein